jgi:hypothetical protein
MPVFQCVVVECANQRFPDMNFQIDSDKRTVSLLNGKLSFKRFFSCRKFGNSDGFAYYMNVDEDSCCFVIEYKPKHIQRNPSEYGIISLYSTILNTPTRST